VRIFTPQQPDLRHIHINPLLVLYNDGSTLFQRVICSHNVSYTRIAPFYSPNPPRYHEKRYSWASTKHEFTDNMA
jgi:hypothetical protein